MKFSERIGITPIRTQLQLDSIDNVLSTQLWNIYQNDFLRSISGIAREEYYSHLWTDFLNNNIDEIPWDSWVGEINESTINEIIKEQYYKSQWYAKYNFIQFIADIETNLNNNSTNHYRLTKFVEKVNNCLIKNLSGYRFVNRTLLPINNEIEVSEIENALIIPDQFTPVQTHLDTAIKLLSNKDKPDYRNTIKESISALESLCKIIIGDEKATLGKALTTLEKQHNLHPSLKSAFSSLYGYTSDAGGFRHGLTTSDDTATFDDAKYILVICSAFINYMKAKYI